MRRQLPVTTGLVLATALWHQTGPVSECGGIGRRAGLRSQYLTVCEFESRHSHQSQFSEGEAGFAVLEIGSDGVAMRAADVPTRIPEPATYIMLLCGLALLSLIRSKVRRAPGCGTKLDGSLLTAQSQG